MFALLINLLPLVPGQPCQVVEEFRVIGQIIDRDFGVAHNSNLSLVTCHFFCDRRSASLIDKVGERPVFLGELANPVLVVLIVFHRTVDQP